MNGPRAREKKSGGSRVRRGTNETFPTPRGDRWVISHNSFVGVIRKTGYQGGSQHLVPRNSPRAIRVQSEKRLHGGRLKGETACQRMSVRDTLPECHYFRGGCARSTLRRWLNIRTSSQQLLTLLSVPRSGQGPTYSSSICHWTSVSPYRVLALPAVLVVLTWYSS